MRDDLPHLGANDMTQADISKRLESLANNVGSDITPEVFIKDNGQWGYKVKSIHTGWQGISPEMAFDMYAKRPAEYATAFELGAAVLALADGKPPTAETLKALGMTAETFTRIAEKMVSNATAKRAKRDEKLAAENGKKPAAEQPAQVEAANHWQAMQERMKANQPTATS